MGKFWGSNTKAARLTEALVERMRERYAAGGVTQGELAREHNISVVQIGRILRNESWIRKPTVGPTEEQQQSTLARLLLTQKEVNEKPMSASEKMARNIAAVKENPKAMKETPNELLDELTGEPNAGSTRSDS